MEQKLIFIDLDGTLTEESTWLLFNLRLGITKEEDKALFEKYLKNDVQYDEWMDELVRIYKSRSSITKNEIAAFAETIPLRDGAEALILKLKEKGFRTVILSGAVDVIVETIARRLGADDWRSNSILQFDEAGMLIGIASRDDEAPGKEQLAQEYAILNGFSLPDAYAVDDGGNGVNLFKKTKGIVFGSHEALNLLAWKKVKTLSEIPELF